MNLIEEFPYMVYVNLGRREDRRIICEKQFRKFGLTVERQPGVSSSWVRNRWGYYSSPRYACSLAKRLAIRRGRQLHAPATLLFEDDVVFPDDLHQRLGEIHLPPDWEIFFLGCRHVLPPEPVSSGLVRVRSALDHHAIAIRGSLYQKAMRALAGTRRSDQGSIHCSDMKFSDLLKDVKAYSALPNLAWQRRDFSDNSRSNTSNYHPDGRQMTDRSAIANIVFGGVA